MITNIIICAACIAVAAVCKALADTLAHHFDTSVFKKKDPKFWNQPVSADHAKIIAFGYKWDAWHITNSVMIIGFISAIYFNPALPWYYTIPAGGAIFNAVFNLFYNKIFR